MIENGFKINECYNEFYIEDTENGYVILCLYIDYMIIVDSNDGMIKSIKDMLNSRINMKDMGLNDVILEIKTLEHHMGLF